MKCSVIQVLIFLVVIVSHNYGQKSPSKNALVPCLFSKDNSFIESMSKDIDEEGWIEFKEDVVLSPGDLFDKYKRQIGMSEDDEMLRLSQPKGNQDMQHIKYQQLYKGIPVECGILIEHFSGCFIERLNGNFLCDLSIDTSDLIDPILAVQVAISDFGEGDFLWKDSIAEQELKIDSDDRYATYFPNPKLVIDCAKNLVYRLKLNTVNKIREYRIDAINGNIVSKVNPVISCVHNHNEGHQSDCNSDVNDTNHLVSDIVNIKYDMNKVRSYNSVLSDDINYFDDDNLQEDYRVKIFFSDVTTYGHTLNSGVQAIRTTYSGTTWIPFALSKHRLIASNYLSNIETRDSELSLEPFPWKRKVTRSGNSENFIWPLEDQIFTQTHWAAQKSYDYFRTVQGTSVGVGNGTIRVNSNGGYDFGALYQGDGRSISFGRLLGEYTGVLDIVGHEFSHLVVDEKSSLATIPNSNFSTGESGSLNESFADILGTMIEREYRPGGWDWIMGDECTAIRNLNDPELSPVILGSGGAQPTIYKGDNWDFIGYGPHMNSGVQNKWFTLLALGGTHNGITIDGIGVDKAADITFYNIANYIHSTSDYLDSRNGAVFSAVDLYGWCSFEHNQTQLAWEAVGVGTVNNCFNKTGDRLICSNQTNLPITVTVNNTFGDQLSWYPVKLDSDFFQGSTMDWTFSTTGINNGILTIMNIPATTIPGNDYYFMIKDEVGNIGWVHFDVVNCPDIAGYDPNTDTKFNDCNRTLLRTTDNVDDEDTELVFYPNPVKDLLFFKALNELSFYRIYDYSGNEVMEGELDEYGSLGVSTLSNGIYIVELLNKEFNKSRYGRFVKSN